MTAPFPKGPRWGKSQADQDLVELAGMVDQFRTFLLQNSQQVGRPVVLPRATVSELTMDPAVFRPSGYRLVFCTDLFGTTSGAPVYSDGVDWRRFDSNSTIS